MLIGNNVEGAVTLTKGVEVSLAKAAEETGTTLEEATIGLSWDRQAEEGEPEFDADSEALVFDKDGKLIPGIAPMIFYGKLENENGSIVHSKDNRTGEGEGYDETIKIKFKQLDPRIGTIIIGLSIHGAADNGQNFGQINNASADVVDDNTGNIAVHIDLTKNLSAATALDAIKFTKEENGIWSCKYTGIKVGSLEALLTKYGIAFN